MKIDLGIMKKVVGLGFSPFFMNATEGILQVSFNRQLLFFGGDLAVSAMTIMLSMNSSFTITNGRYCTRNTANYQL